MSIINIFDNSTIKSQETYQESKPSLLDQHGFTIEESPISLLNSDKPIPKKKALVVDGEVINIVSPRYKVVQPEEIIKSFESSTGMTIDKCISNRSTGGLLLSAKFNTSTSLAGSTEHSVVFYTGHNGQYRTLLTLQSLRLACFNQCNTLLSNDNQHLLNVKHYENIDWLKVKMLLDNADELVRYYDDAMRQLDKKITFADSVDLWLEHKKATESNKDALIAQYNQAYYSAAGQDSLTNDSAIKAFNAVTYLNSHKVRQTSKQLENRYIKNVESSQRWYNVLVA